MPKTTLLEKGIFYKVSRVSLTFEELPRAKHCH